jgi:hypothetical protein
MRMLSGARRRQCMAEGGWNYRYKEPKTYNPAPQMSRAKDATVLGVTSVQSKLVDAIQGRLTMQLVHGKDGGRGERLCHPHILYASTTGKTLVDTWQLGGYSSHALPNWTPLEVARIEGLQLLPDRFESAVGYNPTNRRRYARILASV